MQTLIDALKAIQGKTIASFTIDGYEEDNDAASMISLILTDGSTVEISAEKFTDGDPYDTGSTYSKLMVGLLPKEPD